MVSELPPGGLTLEETSAALDNALASNDSSVILGMLDALVSVPIVGRSKGSFIQNPMSSGNLGSFCFFFGCFFVSGVWDSSFYAWCSRLHGFMTCLVQLLGVLASQLFGFAASPASWFRCFLTSPLLGFSRGFLPSWLF